MARYLQKILNHHFEWGNIIEFLFLKNKRLSRDFQVSSVCDPRSQCRGLRVQSLAELSPVSQLTKSLYCSTKDPTCCREPGRLQSSGLQELDMTEET